MHKQNYNDVSISSCGVHPSRKGPIVGGKKTAEFNRPLLQNTLHIQMHFKPAKSFFPSFFLFSLFPSSSPSSSLIQDCRIAAKKKAHALATSFRVLCHPLAHFCQLSNQARVFTTQRARRAGKRTTRSSNSTIIYHRSHIHKLPNSLSLSTSRHPGIIAGMPAHEKKKPS